MTVLSVNGRRTPCVSVMTVDALWKVSNEVSEEISLSMVGHGTSM